VYDKNLILFTNAAATVATQTATPVDIGIGGTPITHPLVARLFWQAAAATGTLALVVESSASTGGPWAQVGSAAVAVGPALEANRELNVRFITRGRYVRASVGGVIATGVTLGLGDAGRSSPEQEN